MMIWGLNVLKSKKFFALLVLGGLVVLGLDKDTTLDSAVLHQDNEYNTVRAYKKNLSTQHISTARGKTDSRENINASSNAHTLYANDMIENTSNEISETKINEYNMISNGIVLAENTNDNRRLSSDNDRLYDTQRAHSIATVVATDNYKNNNTRMIRTTSNNYSETNQVTRDKELTQNEEIEEDSPHTESDFRKENIEEHAKVSDNSSISSGFITGSPIPTVENNTTNTNSTFSQSNIIIFEDNKSDFPENSNEALHECYINFSGQMQCRKSIVTCTEKDELGLDCSVSYYENGIWHYDPSHLTIASKEEWIRKHLELKTTFAYPKFDKYYEERYADASLIRPDLNATKTLKLKQVKMYVEENTTLDIGLATLIENNNSRTDSSLFTRGTRFGTGHEKIKGSSSELLEGLREFLSSFMYLDDSDAHAVVEHWTLMDDTHSVGDNEDFALTAMEWLLLNGVDPQYITLAEIKSEKSNPTDIILVLETQDPVEKWIVKEADVLKLEEIYPNGYEKRIHNAYKYID